MEERAGVWYPGAAPGLRGLFILCSLVCLVLGNVIYDLTKGKILL